jgi:heterodisulfide reductase subunit B
MSRLEAHKQELYEIRFSTMCKPACEVGNLTQLESHTTRARTLMLWRITEGNISWEPREVELLYQSTLDSISEAFDIFHYPISQIMLDARADVWDAGLAPDRIKKVIEIEQRAEPCVPSVLKQGIPVVLAGELSQVNDPDYQTTLRSILQACGQEINIFEARTGASSYALGARDVAYQQASLILETINKNQLTTILTDGPETAWALERIFPEFNLALPDGTTVLSLSEFLNKNLPLNKSRSEKVFVHDSRPAYFLSDCLPDFHAILPERIEEENDFGKGAVYESPRTLVDKLGAQRVFGPWTRALAKSCGADDGLWLSYPDLANGLARQRLDYAHHLQADSIVTDSPLCASILKKSRSQADPAVYWLPEYLM